MPKAVVFSCKGLGDGLISEILSHNLQINGYEVISVHPFLEELVAWFPSIDLMKMPKDWKALIESADRLFFFYEKLPMMMEAMQYALKAFPEKTLVINPIATRNQDYPFWDHAKFNGANSFVENLMKCCKSVLHLDPVERKNGIVPPSCLQKARFSKRVAIHSESSREGKNWPQEKFLLLCERLKKKGFDPYFLLTKNERVNWPESLSPSLDSLDEMASFIYESGYFIGNDSGLGHLASCLGVPTLTICRSHQSISFWKPDFIQGGAIHPPKWLPNIKGLRLRDRLWKNWVSVNAVEKAFLSNISS